LDAKEAEEHLNLIDDVLTRSERRFHPAPFAYIAWGLVGTCYYLEYVSALGALVEAIGWAGLGLTVIAIATSVWSYSASIRDRYTMLDRQAFAMFAGVSIVMIALKFVWNQSDLVSGSAYALFWSFGFALPLIMLGVAGQRVLLAGGIVLFAGIFAGSLVPTDLSTILAIANLLGITGPGVYMLLRRPHG